MESLPNPARQRAASLLGIRAGAGDPDARAELASLRSSAEAWHRWLATLALGAARDDEALLGFLNDPSERVRGAAWKRLCAVGSDARITHAIAAASDYLWTPKLAVRVLQRRRLPELEAWIASWADPTRPTWIEVLPFASAAVVRTRAALFVQHGSGKAFHRLAMFHPTLCSELLIQELHQGTHARLNWLVQIALPALVKADPDAALRTIHAFFDQEGQVHPIRAALGRLARVRPAETFDRIRARQEAGLPAMLSGLFNLVRFRDADQLGLERLKWAVVRAPACLPEGADGRRWLARLTEADQRALIDHWLANRTSTWGAFLFAYAPDGPARQQAYLGWRAAGQDGYGVLARARFDDLPWDLRHAEARRHLTAIEWLQARPLFRCVYASLLPLDEAHEVLRPWLQHPEGDQRGVGWTHLLAAVRHDRDAGARALALVVARKNEQDPVRSVFLQGIASWPRTRIHDTDLEAVITIVGHALDAADLSAGTAGWAQRLATLVLDRDPERGVALLQRLLETRGSLDGHAVGAHVTIAGARRLDPVLAALATRWLQNERAHAVLGLLWGLGVRLRHMPQTLAAVDDLCRSPHLGVLDSLLALLDRHARDRFVPRALALLDADESIVILPQVAQLLGGRCTDRVDRYLTSVPIQGRFATGRTHWVIDFGRGVVGWTPAQQRAYAAQLDSLLDDPARDVPTAAWALSIRTRLGWVPGAALIARASDPRIPVRDLAIRALPYLDEAEAVEALLECMGDDRARIAAYALRRSLSRRSRAEIIELLLKVPLTRVTVAKEALRMLGELGGSAALPHLVRIGQGPLHRDVRIALLRALWDHLEDPGAWALVEAAAAGDDPIMAQRLLSIPTDRLPAEVDERLCRLYARILARPEADARVGFLATIPGAPVRDLSRVLFLALVHHARTTEDPSEAATALGCTLARMRSEEVQVIVDAIAARLPSRRHAAMLLVNLTNHQNPWAHTAVRKVATRVLPLLLADPMSAVPAIALVEKSKDVGGFMDAVESLLERGHLHHDAVQQALCTVGTLASPSSVVVRWEGHASPVLRRLALGALVAAAAPRNGWTEVRRVQLERFRADPSLEVAAPATWILPPSA